MMIVGIQLPGATSVTEVGRGLTILGGLDVPERRHLAAGLVAALRGEAGTQLKVEVELAGRRRTLTGDLARELALSNVVGAVVVVAADLPGAVTVEALPDLAAAEAEVAEVEARLADLRSELAEARRAATAADDTLLAAKHRVDKEAPAILAASEARLAEARSAADDAGRILDEAERAAAGAEVEHQETASRLRALRAERARLDTERADVVTRLAETSDPADPAAVEAALVGLRRLRQVKPKPSAEATDLTERWAEATARLAALPQPPQPPEWLVIPALAALQEARAALAEAETAPASASFDPVMVETLERAHRDVLEAEQRAMKKGRRANRRRLDAAHAAEQAALAALGVGTYGEYLQGGLPGSEESGAEDRIGAARAALADAEAVWEELHGGQASPDWTAAKESHVAVRREAHELLGVAVEDDQLEERLRNHFDEVVETGWAEEELAEALRAVGADPGGDAEAAAGRWLEESVPQREARRRLEVQLSEIDGRLSAVDEQLAETKADAFFGDAETAAPAPAPRLSRVDVLAQALDAANEAVRQAALAVASAKERLAASEQEQGRIPALEAEATAAQRRADELGVRVDEAGSALATVRSTAGATTTRSDGAGGATSTPGGNVDVSGVVGMEAEAYLLARVAALRGAAGGPLPLVVDAAAVAGLNDSAARRVLRLLGRLVASMQIVILGHDERISTWAEGVGDRASLRAVAR